MCQKGTGKCENCKFGYGFAENFICQLCTDVNCTRCGWNFNICEICAPMYHMNINGVCVRCEDDNCSLCSQS